MLKRQESAKFQSQIFDEREVIQILKVVHWHFCQVYIRCKNYSFTCCLVSEHNSFGMFIHVFQTDTRKLGGVYLVDVSF